MPTTEISLWNRKAFSVLVSNPKKLDCWRKSQLGFGFDLLILPKTETQWMFRNLDFCKAEIPEKRSNLVWLSSLKEYLSNDLHAPRSSRHTPHQSYSRLQYIQAYASYDIGSPQLYNQYSSSVKHCKHIQQL